MIGIDTNVLVRFLVRDELAQFERARRLIKREVGSDDAVLISHLVLLETEWVLRRRRLGCRATATFDTKASNLILHLGITSQCARVSIFACSASRA
jgi:predicted nucleic acid-binding protein